MTQIIKTLKLRIKDKHAKLLNFQAREVNQVFNFVNDLSLKHTQRTGKFFSAYDINRYTTGCTKEGITLHSQTIQAINEEYCTRRKQFKKIKLKWRKSSGARRSLGWIPFKAAAIKYKNGQVHYQGKPISLWDSYGLSKYELESGSFNEDTRGRWYINIVVKQEVESPVSDYTKDVGIDLGCKEAINCSDGQKLVGRQYRKLEGKLAIAQRANNKQRAKAIAAKIKNRRKDELHKFSTALVEQYGAIYIGNVSSKAMAKTKMAKSSLDAGWGMFKTMLAYKCDNADIVYKIVNEAYTTQTCHECESTAGPKGQTGLNNRSWVCSCCGTHHDRDTNAALNIRQRGRSLPVQGIPAL